MTDENESYGVSYSPLYYVRLLRVTHVFYENKTYLPPISWRQQETRFGLLETFVEIEITEPLAQTAILIILTVLDNNGPFRTSDAIRKLRPSVHLIDTSSNASKDFADPTASSFIIIFLVYRLAYVVSCPHRLSTPVSRDSCTR